jgi:hypothetical protein
MASPSDNINELIAFGEIISKEIKNYKDIPAYFQEIKNKLLKAKPMIEKNAGAKYKAEITDYYNKKLLPVIENIKKYEELFLTALASIPDKD